MADLLQNPVLGTDDIKPELEGRRLEGTSATPKTEEREKEMAPPVAGNSIHRSGSRPQLDVSGAAIQGNFEERDPTILLPNQSDDISHLALDIGGEFYFPHFWRIWLNFD